MERRSRSCRVLRFFPFDSTSGLVYPAAELPLRALGHGAAVVHINSVRFEMSS